MDQKSPTAELLSADVLELAETLGIEDLLDEVLDLTQQMFPGRVTVDVQADPEWPGDRYLLLGVEMAGEPKEILDREWKWHQRIHQLLPGCLNTLRISITPR